MRTARALAVAGLLATASTFAAARDLLPIEHGTYVREGTNVDDVPFAAILAFDGATISGPHASACRSTVLSRRGDAYLVSTTCDALGDGTPSALFTEQQQVVVESARQVRFAHGADAASYHLVPAS